MFTLSCWKKPPSITDWLAFVFFKNYNDFELGKCVRSKQEGNINIEDLCLYFGKVVVRHRVLKCVRVYDSISLKTYIDGLILWSTVVFKLLDNKAWLVLFPCKLDSRVITRLLILGVCPRCKVDFDKELHDISIVLHCLLISVDFTGLFQSWCRDKRLEYL